MNSDLSQLFRNCLDTLRTNEALTGRPALNTLGFFLNLKLLETKIGDDLEIDLNELDLSGYSEEDIRKFKDLCIFSNLLQVDEGSLKGNMDMIWNDFLSVHSKTKSFFPKERSFGIKRDKTFKKIIKAIQDFDNKHHICDLDHDILGSIYEEVIQHQMTGRDMGQHFTPTKVKNMMIQLIEPKLFEDGTCETIYDPAMGTGGFLISSARNLIKQSKEKNIDIDWKYMSSGAINGRDPETDTFTLAMSNMLISTGYVFNLQHDDSIRSRIDTKYDIVLANPPFGLKSINYEDVFDKNSIPISSTNGVVLFLQIIIHCMKINGRCAVVLPTGKELNNKKDQSLIMLRKFLMKTCDLKRIIYLPSGVFEHTQILTCVFYFEKKKNGNEVLRFDEKKSKKKNTSDLFLDKNHFTNEVIFSNFNVETEEIQDIVTVSIKDIVNNSYSLNYVEYMKDKNNEDQYQKDIIVKKIRDLFNFSVGPLKATKCDESGIYPVISSSNTHSHSSFVLDGENLFILKIFDGSKGKKYSTKIKYFSGKCNFTDLLYHMNPIHKDIMNIKYIYYFLLNKKDDISKDYQKGACNKSLDLDLFLDYEIPIPSLEIQEEIVEYLDFLFENIQTSEKKIQELKRLNSFYMNNKIKFNKIITKTLNEVSVIQFGKRIVKSKSERGEYPVYGGGDETFSTNSYNREGYQILIGRFALSKECVRLLNKRFYLNDSGLTLDSKDPLVMIKYIGHYLYLNQNRIYELARGAGQKNLDIDAFNYLEIPIPSMKLQNEIVQYCDENESIIQQLESNIEDSKRIANNYLNMVLHISEKNTSIPIEETVEPVVSTIQIIEEAREEAGVREEVSPESVVDAFLQETMQEATVVIPKKKKKKVLPKSSSSE